jgi:hypothetical protein
MESYLGIKQERDRAIVSDNKFTHTDINIARQCTAEVDHDVSNSGERAQKAGAARRVWWEMVDDTPNAVRSLSPHDTLTTHKPILATGCAWPGHRGRGSVSCEASQRSTGARRCGAAHRWTTISSRQASQRFYFCRYRGKGSNSTQEDSCLSSCCVAALIFHLIMYIVIESFGITRVLCYLKFRLSNEV